MFLRDAGDCLALRVDGVASVLLVPVGEARRLVHVLDYLPPADAGVVGAETYLALLRAVGDDAHLRAPEVVVEQVLEPHALDAQHAPGVRGVVRTSSLHAVVAVAVRACRGRLEEVDDLRDRKTFGRSLRLEVAHDAIASCAIVSLRPRAVSVITETSFMN